MQDYVWWWVIAGALGVAELVTGTFYLLVLAVASLAASGAAKLGWGLPLQLLCAAVVALAGWAFLRSRKSREPDALQALDVGEVIEVRDWKGHEGMTQYRGANWSVGFDGELPPGGLPAGRYRIHALRGNRLIVRDKEQ